MKLVDWTNDDYKCLLWKTIETYTNCHWYKMQTNIMCVNWIMIIHNSRNSLNRSQESNLSDFYNITLRIDISLLFLN